MNHVGKFLVSSHLNFSKAYRNFRNKKLYNKYWQYFFNKSYLTSSTRNQCGGGRGNCWEGAGPLLGEGELTPNYPSSLPTLAGHNRVLSYCSGLQYYCDHGAATTWCDYVLRRDAGTIEGGAGLPLSASRPNADRCGKSLSVRSKFCFPNRFFIFLSSKLIDCFTSDGNFPSGCVGSPHYCLSWRDIHLPNIHRNFRCVAYSVSDAHEEP